MVLYGDSITWKASTYPGVWGDYFGDLGAPSAPLGVIFNQVSDLAYRITTGDELFTLPPKVVVSRRGVWWCTKDRLDRQTERGGEAGQAALGHQSSLAPAAAPGWGWCRVDPALRRDKQAGRWANMCCVRCADWFPACCRPRVVCGPPRRQPLALLTTPTLTRTRTPPRRRCCSSA